MPDHVHLILTPLLDTEAKRTNRLPEILQGIKSASAHAIAKRIGSKLIWQEESFDHLLRSSESLDAKMLYLLQNPVRTGLVAVWSEYPWIWHKPFPNPYSPESLPS